MKKLLNWIVCLFCGTFRSHVLEWAHSESEFYTPFLVKQFRSLATWQLTSIFQTHEYEWQAHLSERDHLRVAAFTVLCERMAGNFQNIQSAEAAIRIYETGIVSLTGYPKTETALRENGRIHSEMPEKIAVYMVHVLNAHSPAAVDEVVALIQQTKHGAEGIHRAISLKMRSREWERAADYGKSLLQMLLCSPDETVRQRAIGAIVEIGAISKTAEIIRMLEQAGVPDGILTVQPAQCAQTSNLEHPGSHVAG